MSGFQSTISHGQYNSINSFNSTDIPNTNKKQKESNQINISKSKKFFIYQGISFILTFLSSLFIGKLFLLHIIQIYVLMIFNAIYTFYKVFKLCPFFIHKIGYGLYPLLFTIFIIPIFSNYYVISWNPLTLFNISIYQLVTINFYYFPHLQICVYYNDFYKLVYLFHFLFTLIGIIYPLFTNITTSKNHKMNNSYKLKGFLKNTFVHNENTSHYIFNSLESNLSKLSESNFHYYKSKRINEKMKTKSQELDLFFIENIATCHNIISLNNKLTVQTKNEIDLPLFESIGWKIYEPLNIVESNISYNELISTFVRPKQEKDLQQKINAHCNAQQMDEDEEDTTEEEENELLNDKKEEILMKEHYELGIIKNFQSSVNNKKTTVIVRDVNDSYYKVYSKGPIEEIVKICKSETIPSELNEVISEYKANEDKYVVLGLSAKMVKMSYTQSQGVKREGVETNMIFLGVVIVEKI